MLTAAQNRLRGWEKVAERFNVFAMHAALYRLLGGRVMGKNVLLLTTTGRKSGRKRTTPLFYVRDGDDYVIVASNGGDDQYPGWWHNLRASPSAEIQVRAQRHRRSAEEVQGDQVDAQWLKLTAVYRGYERYRQRTQRPLTMFRLRRMRP